VGSTSLHHPCASGKYNGMHLVVAHENQEVGMTAAGIRGGRRVTYRKPKERERATRYRHKGDSLTAVRLIGVTGWKINGLARMVQGWAKGAGRRRSRGMAP